MNEHTVINNIQKIDVRFLMNQLKVRRRNMIIKLNGEDTEVADGATVLDILKEKEVDPKTVVVEADGEISKQDEFETVKLHEGSVVEVLRFVGGG